MNIEQLLQSGKKYCYTILATSYVKGKGYIPSIVFENESGHFPLAGNPAKMQEAWYWGEDLETAKKIAAEKNAELGISEEEAFRIVGSSMFAKK